MRKGRTGGCNSTWVEIATPKPPKVDDDTYAYWPEDPFDPTNKISARCRYWMEQIEAGWLPNRRWTMGGRESQADIFGVYVWEMTYILIPAYEAKMRKL